MISPNSVSSAEAGSREVISASTGRPVASELPRLPWARSLDVTRELFGQRLVEAERLADLGDRLRRRRRAGEIHRRVAGQHARQQKRHDDDADQRRNDGHEALKDIRQHAD